MKLYIFHRLGGWYPLELKDDDTARKNAELNPGTLKVEIARTKKIVWIPTQTMSKDEPK
jgi:hypothetical protein